MRKGFYIFFSYLGGFCLVCGGWRGVLDRDLKEIRLKNVREAGRGVLGL